MLLLVAGITVLLAGAVAYVMASTVTRRLRRLRHTTELLAEGRLDARTRIAGGAPEIRSLARSVNKMADRLEDLLHQQRAFAGDASHQLRTPLTALRLRLDSAAELVETDPEAARDTLAPAQEEAFRLQRIIDGLLMLSRVDAEITPEQVDLAEVARAGGPMAASRRRIRRADSRGGTVEVAVGPGLDTDFVDLHVRDEGPGMSTEDCARAFDRFWRGRGDTGGSGLGLAIVARLAHASGATVELTPRMSTGSVGLDAHVRFARSPTRH